MRKLHLRQTGQSAVRDAASGRTQTIVSNRIHPYFVQLPEGTARLQLVSSEGHDYRGPIQGGAWIDAQNLKPGYRLMSGDKSWSEVVEVRIEDKPLKAYNLTVAQFRTYFVRGTANDNAQPVWVHNICYRDYISSAWKNTDGSYKWRNPLTGRIENIVKGTSVHGDHLLPKKFIEGIPGFDGLPDGVRDTILNDPRNLMPMIAGANCSKGCKVEFDPQTGGWLTWGGNAIDAGFKNWLNTHQTDYRSYIEGVIAQHRRGR